MSDVDGVACERCRRKIVAPRGIRPGRPRTRFCFECVPPLGEVGRSLYGQLQRNPDLSACWSWYPHTESWHPRLAQCGCCQRQFERHGRRYEEFTYCSRRCRDYVRDWRNRVTSTVGRWADCGVCGKRFHRQHHVRHGFCGDTCNDYWHNRTNTLPDRSRVIYKICRQCLATYIDPTGATLLCEPCAMTRQATRKHLIRAARRRGRRDYTTAEIARRDNWTCHICAKKVRRGLSGLHPDGPTIDHLVPLSAGGDDLAYNVALAHRQCNVRRGAHGAAQLRLVG